jgi:hypothetical protein
VLDVRISRLGTNTGDVLIGDTKLMGAQVYYTATNNQGGF